MVIGGFLISNFSVLLQRNKIQENKAMQEEEQKSPVNRFEVACEIVSLTVLAVAVYIGGLLLLYFPIAFHMPEWFFGPLGCFIILGFDIVWITGRRLWNPLRSKTRIIKKTLSVLIFSLSASVLTCWLVLNILRRFTW